MAFSGADIADLERLARELSRAARSVEETRSQVTAAMSGLGRWTGPRADAFRAEWKKSAPILTKAAAALADASTDARRNAKEQQTASTNSVSAAMAAAFATQAAIAAAAKALAVVEGAFAGPVAAAEKDKEPRNPSVSRDIADEKFKEKKFWEKSNRSEDPNAPKPSPWGIDVPIEGDKWFGKDPADKTWRLPSAFDRVPLGAGSGPTEAYFQRGYRGGHVFGANEDGVYAAASVSADASLGIRRTTEMGGVTITDSREISARAYAEAGLSVGRTKDGFGASGGAGGGVTAGIYREIGGEYGDVKASLRGGVQVGVEAKLKADVGVHDGKFGLKYNAGFAFGFGGKMSGEVEVPVKPIVSAAKGVKGFASRIIPG